MRVLATMEPNGGYPVGVVVDALRASSTIVTALALGAEAIVPLTSPRELRDADGPTIGERHGKKLDIADYGNSPTELLRNPEGIEGETVYMVTTNGTEAILRTAEACERVLIGALLNASAVAAELDRDTCIVEAGHRGRMAIEDAFTAGYLARLSRGEPADRRTRVLIELSKAFQPLDVFRSSRTSHVLELHGKDRDVDFCARVDEFDVVPVFEDGMVVPG
ncbi:MAG: 2-phosphosulfolactate phosphatase [Euryarchaeota archaeon]